MKEGRSLDDSPPRIGFVGLGIMGRPMAQNLMKAGHSLVVYDIVLDAVQELAKAGASVATSVREAAASSDVLITMLPDSPDVQGAYLGPDGAFGALRPGWLAIDMSSIAPRVARELAARAMAGGADMLDAPVSGGDAGARAGTLSIMVGGAPAAFERARPILTSMGKTIVHLGPAGAGQVAKACNQVVVALVIEAVSEGLILGAKAGVDLRRLIEVLQGGLAATRVLEMRQENMLSDRFPPGFRVRLHLKDLRNALDLARESEVVLPLTAEVEQLMQALRVAGRADFDHSSLITVLEDLACYRLAQSETAGTPTTTTA
jgi:2-hydroxy-3-oxopropionate reductase